MTTMPPEPPDPGMPYGGGYGDPAAPIPAPPGQWAGPPLAEWPQRAIGALVDGVIVYVPYLLLYKLSGFGLAVLVATGLGLYLQYVQGTTGQTPGKKVAKTRLLREADGQPLGFGLAVGRSYLHFVDVLPCFIGLLWPIWDAKKQTFADKIVSSVVIVA